MRRNLDRYRLRSFLAGVAVAAVATGAATAQTGAPSAAAAAAAAAAGAALPAWRVADVCKRDSVVGQCDLFETRAAGTVSGSWIFIPDDIRARCLSEASKPDDQSWRLLAACIEGAMGRNIDRRAVMTIHTPAGPVPPRRVVVPVAAPVAAPAAIAMPPPVPPAVPTVPPAAAPKQ